LFWLWHLRCQSHSPRPITTKSSRHSPRQQQPTVGCGLILLFVGFWHRRCHKQPTVGPMAPTVAVMAPYAQRIFGTSGCGLYKIKPTADIILLFVGCGLWPTFLSATPFVFLHLRCKKTTKSGCGLWHRRCHNNNNNSPQKTKGVAIFCCSRLRLEQQKSFQPFVIGYADNNKIMSAEPFVIGFLRATRVQSL
jgi:hypothetical protein